MTGLYTCHETLSVVNLPTRLKGCWLELNVLHCIDGCRVELNILTCIEGCIFELTAGLRQLAAPAH